MSSPTQVIFFHSIIKHSFPSTSIFPRVIIAETKSLLYFCTWFRFLGWLMKSLPPMTSIGVKIVSPILHVDGSIYFSFSSIFSKLSNIELFLLFHYHHLLPWIQYIIKHMFLLDLPSLTPIFLINLSPGPPSKDTKYGRGNTWYISKYLTKNWGYWDTQHP